MPAATTRKDLVLILARELAMQIASPAFLVDAEANLVFYNERAEQVLGIPFAEAGEMTPVAWAKRWAPEDPESGALPIEELPLAITVAQQKPAHRPLRITGADGVRRVIEVTAFPLFSRENTFVGAVAIFWEAD